MGLARSVGSARRLPRCSCSTSTSTGMRCRLHVTTSSRTMMPSWPSAVRLRSESGCSSVHRSARRRATREGCCASPPVIQGARYGLPGPRTGCRPRVRGGREINPNSKRQLGLAAQRQRAADRVVAGRQRPAQRKEYFERVKAEKAMFDVKVGEDALLHAQNKMRDAATFMFHHDLDHSRARPRSPTRSPR